MSYPNYIFSIFSFLGFLCCAIPFPWHLEAWNVGTCLYMLWVGSSCLIFFINSIIWTGNAYDVGKLWCDITTKWLIGASIAVPTAALCINRRLYHIASVRAVHTGQADKLRTVVIDLAIGMGVPSLIMILHFIPQGHRYNVFEDVGCFPFVWNATTAYAVTWAPHLVISLISLVYCVLTIRAFWQTRSQLNELLSSGGYRNLNTARYFRLMALAGTDAICTTPMVILVIVQNINLGVIEWIGWSDAHILWDRVDQFPSMLWANSPMGPVLELNRWAFPACAFVFFAFFGFADEAMKNYRSAAKSISRTIGLSTASEETFNGAGSKSKGINASNGTLPSFVRKSKRNSLDSISDGTSSHIGSEKQEKHPDIFNPDFSYGALTLNDAGGILAAPSASASTSSVSTPVDTKPPAFPPPALTRSSSEIEETSRTPSPTQAHDEKRAHTPDMV